jgi:site-specific DNA-methyltransferase (adenine-specific)
MIELLNMDCMDYMAGLPDKAFELAIVDPPYGIGDFNASPESRKLHKGKVEWNNACPTEKYFIELSRVSKNRIIWGFNYYGGLVEDRGVIVHDKTGGGKKPTTASYSDCDIASHSFGVNMKIFHYIWQGNVQGGVINWKNSGSDGRIHPCQKPIALYEWLLTNYAKPGDRILDTHLGSGSSAIAAHNLGFDFVGMELDADYYAAACNRFEQHKAQASLFQTDDYDRVTLDYKQQEIL